LGCDREQAFLLPASLDEWLPEDHFARFVIAAVEAMDMSAFYVDYRADGRGRPAHDPAMMVALLVCAYARGQRSSRVIERGCLEDIAFRVISANRRPDHTTIARFRQRHERALAALFGQVLGLCTQAGLAASRCWRSMGRTCTPTRPSARCATIGSSPMRRSKRRRDRRRGGRALRGRPWRRTPARAGDRPRAQEVA
jgi:transposase